MNGLQRSYLLVAASALCGCPVVTNDPPPPASKPEIALAPPRARGALAAGTDAAPKPDSTPGAELLPSLPLPPGGAGPDAGAPEAGKGHAHAQPDAGMAL